MGNHNSQTYNGRSKTKKSGYSCEQDRETFMNEWREVQKLDHYSKLWNKIYSFLFYFFNVQRVECGEMKIKKLG